MNKKIIGSWGESFAKNYLKNKGYQILETNWHHHHKEIDIITYKNEVIAFEVKTRTQSNPPFTILKAKQVSRLRLSLKAYCRLKRLNYNQARLDLIYIKIKDKNTVIVKHYLDI
jgi:putative endonuclease